MKRLIILFMIISLLAVSCTNRVENRRTALLHEENEFNEIRYAENAADFSISVPQAFVFNMDSGEIIYSKGAEYIVYPASTTKLLTALAAMSVLEMTEIVTPGDELELVPEHSSIAYIRDNHKLSVEMLIEGMLIPSGNDAAYVLAAAAGRKIADNKSVSAKDAVSRFVDYMNEYAADIGMIGSHFSSPDGFASEDTYSTLEDMLILARKAALDPIISKYCAMPQDSVVYESGHTNTWVNTNKMLSEDSSYYSPYVIGLKTGSSEQEKSLIVRAADGEKDYLIGIFSAADDGERYKSALKVIDGLFE